MVKNLPVMQETWVRSLGWEDPEKGMVTHSNILAWRIPRAEDLGGLQSVGSLSDLHAAAQRWGQFSNMTSLFSVEVNVTFF